MESFGDILLCVAGVVLWAGFAYLIILFAAWGIRGITGRSIGGLGGPRDGAAGSRPGASNNTLAIPAEIVRVVFFLIVFLAVVAVVACIFGAGPLLPVPWVHHR